MKEIRDPQMLETYFAEQQPHFQQRPEALKLIRFEKGELLNGPLSPLKSFYIVAEGSVYIYYITEDGAVRHISKAETGTLLGDIEFSGKGNEPYYTEAAEKVICLAIPFDDNKSALENDPVFLRFVLGQLAEKLSLSSRMDAVTQTLEEKLLFYLTNVKSDHEISSVSQTVQFLHCSRRQLQRVLKRLCDDGALIKKGRGCYKLKEQRR